MTVINPLTLFIPVAETVDPLKLGHTIAQNQPALHQALLDIGTVHFARFVVLDRSKPNLKFDPANPGTNTGQFVLAVITEYDNDFSVYVKAFVQKIGDIFNALLAFSADGQALIKVQDNADAFVSYVANNDATNQQPDMLFGAYTLSVKQIIGLSGDSAPSA